LNIMRIKMPAVAGIFVVFDDDFTIEVVHLLLPSLRRR
jgi:hypothetical protein